MSIKIYQPTTPSRRKMSVVSFSEITKNKPEKSLVQPLKKKAGRDRFGHISVRHQGGGHKRKIRLVSSLVDHLNQEGLVKAIEYDPNRSSFIALLQYDNHSKIYIISPHELKSGDKLIAAEKTAVKIGNRMKLKNIPVGIVIHDLEIIPGQGGKMVKSAGSSAVISAQAEQEGKNSHYVQVKLPSGEIKLINQDCYASIGKVSNIDHNSIRIGKAGRNRWKGIRPTVRGTAMYPAAHPHGGGEGRSPVGLKHPKTPWGKPALGYKTRRNQRTDRFIIKRRK